MFTYKNIAIITNGSHLTLFGGRLVQGRVCIIGTALAAVMFGSVGMASADDALLIRSGGMDSILVDEKDQGLLKALHLLIDERLLELPGEFGAPPDFPIEAVQVGVNAFTGPMSFRLGMLKDADPMAGPPVYAQLDIYAADRDRAMGIARTFGQLLAMSGGGIPTRPSDIDGVTLMQPEEGVNLYFGIPEGGNTFTIALNELDLKPPNIGEMGLPRNVQPAVAFKLDFNELAPLAEMFMQQMGPQGDMMRGQLEAMGLMGDDAMSITAACGHTADRCLFTARIVNGAALNERMGMTVGPLTASHLQMIPADATYATISRSKLSGIGQAMEMMMAQMAEMGAFPADEDPFAMIQQQIGIHPIDDFFAHLGDTIGYYTSDTTGNGGILSSVLFVELSNPAGFQQTLARLEGMINQMAGQETDGHVQIRTRKIGNQSVTSLMFPGLPIPLELSYGIHGDYLYAALAAENVVAAINQTNGSSSNITENPRFREMGGDRALGAQSVSFTDTPRLAGSGHGLTTLLCKAMENVVRSPNNERRDVGTIMPSSADLVAGAKATVTITKVDGADYVMMSQGDRSILVNISAGIGWLGGSSLSLASPLLTSLTMGMGAEAEASTAQLAVLFSAFGMHEAGLLPLLSVFSDESFRDALSTYGELIEGTFVPLN